MPEQLAQRHCAPPVATGTRRASVSAQRSPRTSAAPGTGSARARNRPPSSSRSSRCARGGEALRARSARGGRASARCGRAPASPTTRSRRAPAAPRPRPRCSNRGAYEHGRRRVQVRADAEVGQRRLRDPPEDRRRDGAAVVAVAMRRVDDDQDGERGRARRHEPDKRRVVLGFRVMPVHQLRPALPAADRDGQDRPVAPTHRQQSMVIVPADTPA